MRHTSGTSTEPGTRPDPASSEQGEFLYEAFYAGAFGGSVVALLFLVPDAVAGHALLTPSRMGMALFTERAPGTVMNVHLNMVALYSIAHFGAFFLFGAIGSKIHDAIESWPVVAAVLFATMSVAFLIASLTLLDGVGGLVGWHWILLANLAAAITMAAFITRARRNAEA